MTNACLHRTGYWINKETGNFRCYKCGCQFFLYELPRRKRVIEVWMAD